MEWEEEEEESNANSIMGTYKREVTASQALTLCMEIHRQRALWGEENGAIHVGLDWLTTYLSFLICVVLGKNKKLKQIWIKSTGICSNANHEPPLFFKLKTLCKHW